MPSRGCVLWFVGLSGSGKSTIANALDETLKAHGVLCERLDGDIMRESLCKELGFSKEDRDKNIERASYVAKLLSRNGVVVIASFITPYEAQRERVRKSVSNYIEIFVDTPIGECEKRDPKGLYQKAREGKIKNFTGVSDPFERPMRPEITLKSGELSVSDSVDKILGYLSAKQILLKKLRPRLDDLRA